LEICFLARNETVPRTYLVFQEDERLGMHDCGEKEVPYII
jgi:hypothetical protein